MTKMKLKKDDMVIVNSGNEKGKKGKIINIDRKNNKVLVKDVNVRTMHVKAKKQGEESGIIKKEGYINASKVNFYCEKCGKGVKLGIKTEKDSTKSRFCKKCKEIK